MITYRWDLTDLENIKTNGYKVFSCFGGGGGSSMGYKLAGFDVIGNLEIDAKINTIYKHNLNPKYNYNMDIRDFIKLEPLPNELYNLDILDGSPPCSSFSMSGNREKDWGKKKRFVEGGKLQTLDDLFFEFIRVAEKLSPKLIVAENVTGLVMGNAKSYVNKIIRKLKDANYTTQIFLLNAATMGVPQSRPRIFFIAYRNDLELPKLELFFNEKPIFFNKVKEKDAIRYKKLTKSAQYIWNNKKYGDKNFSDVLVRIENRYSMFNLCFIYDDRVCNTLSTNRLSYILFSVPRYLTDSEIKLISSFPMDYRCICKRLSFVCGMSVPPIMMYKIAQQIYLQWLGGF